MLFFDKCQRFVPILNKFKALKGHLCNNLSSLSGIQPVKLAYTDYNKHNSKETPLVVLHGLFGARGNWQSICKALERKLEPRRRLLAVDARNHGNSEHSDVHSYEAISVDLKRFLDDLNIEKVIFLAHSMGGRAAMFFSITFPEIVEHLMVVDISPISNSKDLGSMFNYFKAMRTAPLINDSLSAARQSADKHLSQTIKNPNIRAFLLTNLVENNGEIQWRINLEALENNYSNVATFPLTVDERKQYPGPTTFIKGELSDYIRTSDHATIKELFPRATIATVTGAGHWTHADRPIEFQDIVVQQLKRQQ